MMDNQTLSMLPPKLLAQYLRDPQAMIALDIMQKGGDTSPIKGGWGEGLARMGQGLLGGLMAGKLREDYNTKAQGVADERAKAMAAAMGGKYMDAAGMLSAPDNQDLAGTMFGAKINQDQMGAQQAFQQQQAAAQQAFQQAQQDRSFSQQRDMQNAMLDRQIGFEKFKIESDPQKKMLQQLMDARGGQGAPTQNMPPMPPNMTPMPSNMTTQPPAQEAQPTGGVDPLFTFALTGKMPEGFGVNAQGQMVPIQGAQRKLSVPEQKELFDTMDLVNSGEAAQTSLNEANKVLNDPTVKPYSGFGAETIAAANRIPLVGALIDDKRATATTNIKNAVSEQALNQLKAIFGGMPTEGERQVLMDLQALPSYSPQEQQMILNRALKAAETRLSYNRNKAQGIQTGGYKTMPIGQQPNTQDPLGLRQ